MMSIKEAVYTAFTINGLDYKEMDLDDIALNIVQHNEEYKDYNPDVLRKQISSYLASAVTKTVKGKRVENKASQYERVKNGKGGYKKGVYRLRKPKKQKAQPVPAPIIPLNAQTEIGDSNYTGSAGEMAVCSELLFREYNVSRMSVDDGVDIVAIKDGKTYYIQVKTVNVKSNSFTIQINQKSFNKYCSNDCYYIIVARTATNGIPVNQYLVFTADNLKLLMMNGNISPATNGKITVSFTQNDGHIYVKKSQVDSMLNSFDRIK